MAKGDLYRAAFRHAWHSVLFGFDEVAIGAAGVLTRRPEYFRDLRRRRCRLLRERVRLRLAWRRRRSP